VEERDGWETVHVDGETVGIRTSAIEEKCQAFQTLVFYCSTLQGRFVPYLAQSLELTLPSLRFYFHDGVREACTMYVFLSLRLFMINDQHNQAGPHATILREDEQHAHHSNGDRQLTPAHQLHAPKPTPLSSPPSSSASVTR
jgi:hypothetical protein